LGLKSLLLPCGPGFPSLDSALTVADHPSGMATAPLRLLDLGGPEDIVGVPAHQPVHSRLRKLVSPSITELHVVAVPLEFRAD